MNKKVGFYRRLNTAVLLCKKRKALGIENYFYASFCQQQKKEAEPSARLQRSVFLVGWTPPFCSAKTEKPSIPKNAARGGLLRTKRPPLGSPARQRALPFDPDIVYHLEEVTLKRKSFASPFFAPCFLGRKRRNDKMNSAHSFGARRYKTGCSGVSPEWHLFAILSFARERKYQENCEPTFARLFTVGARPHSANRSVSVKRRGSNREAV